LSGAGVAAIYPDVTAGTVLTFPRDDGAHPAFRNEWWYVTGWLTDLRRRELGFQVTFFRNRPGIAEHSASRFAPRQLLFAHAALADPEVGHLRYEQRAARKGFGLAEASSAGTDVHIGDWSLAQDGERYTARIHARDFALDLALVADSPVLLQGNAGVSRKGPDPRDASFYYSRPRLKVDGTIAAGDVVRQLEGSAWLDHEWSSRYLPAGAVGWDWTALDLDDGGALMLFRIRGRDGTAIWVGGAYRDPRGRTQSFAPDKVDFVPLARWRSPRTGIDYPVSFRIRAGDIEVSLAPLFPDQELDARASVGIVYWEGAVRATLAGRSAGRGYLELTGYGEPLQL
jgi:predicted secreted hydrolase